MTLAVLLLTASTGAQDTRQELDAPDQWVPFAADLRITRPDGSQVVGRVYRSSSGSERIEQGATLGNPRVIIIMDRGAGAIHTWTASRGWTSEPAWQLNEAPPSIVAPMEDWKPARVAINQDHSGVLDIVDSYRAVDRSGTIEYIVPALNSYVVFVKRPSGWSRKLSSIEMMEPDPALFDPALEAPLTVPSGDRGNRLHTTGRGSH